MRGHCEWLSRKLTPPATGSDNHPGRIGMSKHENRDSHIVITPVIDSASHDGGNHGMQAALDTNVACCSHRARYALIDDSRRQGQLNPPHVLRSAPDWPLGIAISPPRLCHPSSSRQLSILPFLKDQGDGSVRASLLYSARLGNHGGPSLLPALVCNPRSLLHRTTTIPSWPSTAPSRPLRSIKPQTHLGPRRHQALP